MARRTRKTSAADEWAKTLPAGFPEITTLEHNRAVWIASGLWNPKKPRRRRGIPESVPSPTLEGNEWKNKSSLLSSACTAYEAGYSDALLSALWWHLIFAPDEPLPPWIRRAVGVAIQLRNEGITASLDESLGLLKPYKKRVHSSALGTLRIRYAEGLKRGLRPSEVRRVLAGWFGVSRNTMKELLPDPSDPKRSKSS